MSWLHGCKVSWARLGPSWWVDPSSFPSVSQRLRGRKGLSSCVLRAVPVSNGAGAGAAAGGEVKEVPGYHVHSGDAIHVLSLRESQFLQDFAEQSHISLLWVSFTCRTATLFPRGRQGPSHT